MNYPLMPVLSYKGARHEQGTVYFNRETPVNCVQRENSLGFNVLEVVF